MESRRIFRSRRAARNDLARQVPAGRRRRAEAAAGKSDSVIRAALEAQWTAIKSATWDVIDGPARRMPTAHARKIWVDEIARQRGRKPERKRKVQRMTAKEAREWIAARQKSLW